MTYPANIGGRSITITEEREAILGHLAECLPGGATTASISEATGVDSKTVNHLWYETLAIRSFGAKEFKDVKRIHVRLINRTGTGGQRDPYVYRVTEFGISALLQKPGEGE